MNVNDIKKILLHLFRSDVAIALLTREKLKKLPLDARHRFQYYHVEAHCVKFFLAVEEDDSELGRVAVYSKWRHRLESIFGGLVVFAMPALAAIHRHRYNKEGLAYISEDGSAYVPGLICANLKPVAVKKPERADFSSLAQLLVIREITRGDLNGATQSNLAGVLGYSKVAIGNAVRELVRAGLCRYDGCVLMNYRGKSLWENSLPMLKSPVLSTHYLRTLIEETDVLTAGASALARLSLLEAPDLPVVALGRKEYLKLKKMGKLDESTDDYDAVIQLQVWGYAPQLSAGKDAVIVDSMSLYLSMMTNADDRVEQELSRLKMPW